MCLYWPFVYWHARVMRVTAQEGQPLRGAPLLHAHVTWQRQVSVTDWNDGTSVGITSLISK